MRTPLASDSIRRRRVRHQIKHAVGDHHLVAGRGVDIAIPRIVGRRTLADGVDMGALLDDDAASGSA